MISAAMVDVDSLVVEIGPGKGALTKPLLQTGARVIAFELDQRMVDYLNVELAEYVASGQLRIVHQDILEVDIAEATDGQPYRVVANIPYYITNLIIRTFLSTEHQPEVMSLLIQKEVAERIVSRDGKESILSLSVKLFAQPKYIMKVGRQYFSPSPKVDSAIIGITHIMRPTYLSAEYENTFFEIIKSAFGQKRKQAIKNLSKIAPREYWQNIFTELDIDIKSRAEDIPYLKWIAIIDKHSSC